MALASHLAELSPQESDRLLAGIWKSFVHTEAYEALQLALDALRASAAPALLNPTSAADVRAHAAGQTLAVDRLLATIRAAATFDPDTAEYGPAETGPADSGMATPDPFTIL